MQTRSGRVFGSDAHFYYDVSEIPEAGEIEMQDLVTPGVQYTIVDPQAESSFVNALADVTLFTEDQLVDFYNESFDNAQLILEGQTEAEERYTFPIPISTTAIKPFVVDIGNGIFYSSPTHISTNNYSPKFPFIPVSPGVTVNMYSDDYYLDPSLLKRKRKRSDDF